MEKSRPHKRCTKCGNDHPATPEYFHRCRARKDGLYSWCKECNRAHVRKWNVDNSEHHSQMAMAWNRANPAKSKASIQRWKKRNPHKIAQYSAKHYKKYGSKIRAKRTTAKARMLGRIAAAKRRARILAGGGSFSANDIRRQYKAQRGKCYYCKRLLRKKFHADHIVPVSRGGSSRPENIVLACATCNHRKSNKLPHEWPEGGRLL